MTLMVCPECAAQVSDAAASCPHCGYPVQSSIKTRDADPVITVVSAAKGSRVRSAPAYEPGVTPIPKSAPTSRSTTDRVGIALGAVLAVVVAATVGLGFAYFTHPSASAPKVSPVDSAEGEANSAVQSCKYERMKVYMSRGRSLFDADAASQVDCVRSLATPARHMVSSGTALDWLAADQTAREAASTDFVRATVGAHNSAQAAERSRALNACITEAASGRQTAAMSLKELATACLAMLNY